MNAIFPDFIQVALGPQNWATFVLITARLGGLMTVAPVWSMQSMPRAPRAAITLVLAIFLLPMSPRTAMPDQVIDMPFPIAAEMMVGVCIGLTAAVLVNAAAMAGEVLSMQMGLSIAPALSPVPEMQVAGIAPVTSLLSMLIYLSMGGHLVLLQGLAHSFQVLPPGCELAFVDGGQAAARVMGIMFSCAVSAAAPVMVALLLTNVALAILSKAVPQLNAMMVSFPITVGVGLIMFGASLPIVSSAIAGWFSHLPGSVDTMIQQLKI